ncbi:MAG: RluA family pseudouridine synthase [Verrucomicrobia bacterium]|nr:RluA family pseudouridine synthase [Verrucomicrobiota bacterium]
MIDYEKFGPEPPLISEVELRSWVIHEDDDLLVFNKPGWVVCHPSKNGPWSSLVGAAREVFGLDTVHLISRLDRETSGIVIIAKHRRIASICQTAVADRMVRKTYLAILEGNLSGTHEVSKALEPDTDGPIHSKQRISTTGGGQKAQTTFKALDPLDGRTWVKVTPHTGRKHQIRAHAQWLGHPIVGDKLYGADPLIYLQFAETGWTPQMESILGFPRQALHSAGWAMDCKGVRLSFTAEIPADLLTLANNCAPNQNS